MTKTYRQFMTESSKLTESTYEFDWADDSADDPVASAKAALAKLPANLKGKLLSTKGFGGWPTLHVTGQPDHVHAWAKQNWDAGIEKDDLKTYMKEDAYDDAEVGELGSEKLTDSEFKPQKKRPMVKNKAPRSRETIGDDESIPR